MTQDEIIRMVYEAGGVKGEHTVLNHTWFELTDEQLERFAALVAAHEKKFWMEQIEVECNEAVLAEREACAKVCDKISWLHEEDQVSGLEGCTRVDAADDCAAAIRARGE